MSGGCEELVEDNAPDFQSPVMLYVKSKAELTNTGELRRLECVSVQPPGPTACARHSWCHCPHPSRTQTWAKRILRVIAAALLFGQAGERRLCGSVGLGCGTRRGAGIGRELGRALASGHPQSKIRQHGGLGTGWVEHPPVGFGVSPGTLFMHSPLWTPPG